MGVGAERDYPIHGEVGDAKECPPIVVRREDWKCYELPTFA